MPSKFIHRQTDFFSEETGVTSSPRRSLSEEIILHKNAPVLESSEKINPCGVIRLKAHLFLFFVVSTPGDASARFSHQIRSNKPLWKFLLELRNNTVVNQSAVAVTTCFLRSNNNGSGGFRSRCAGAAGLNSTASSSSLFSLHRATI